MTACTSPLRTVRSMPRRISLPCDAGPQAFDASAQLTGHLHAGRRRRRRRSVYTGTGRVAGSELGSPVVQREAPTVLPALELGGCRRAPRPRSERCSGGCTCRRWRTSRRSIRTTAILRPPITNRRASPSGDVVDGAEPRSSVTSSTSDRPLVRGAVELGGDLAADVLAQRRNRHLRRAPRRRSRRPRAARPTPGGTPRLSR